MQRRTYIQIILFILVFILIFLTFNFYKSDKSKNKDISNNLDENNLEKLETLNIIENISYSSKDSLGNQYKILTNLVLEPYP